MIGEGAARIGKTVKCGFRNCDDVGCTLRLEISRLRQRMCPIKSHLQCRGGRKTACHENEADKHSEADPERRSARDAGKRVTQESRTCETRHRRAAPPK